MDNQELLNEKINKVENRVEHLEKDRTQISRISTILETQVHMNQEQDKFLREQSQTLVKMNENLTSLNKTTSKLDNQMATLEERLNNNMIHDLQEKNLEEKKHSINILFILQKIFYTVIVAGGVGAIVYLIQVLM